MVRQASGPFAGCAPLSASDTSVATAAAELRRRDRTRSTYIQRANDPPPAATSPTPTPRKLPRKQILGSALRHSSGRRSQQKLIPATAPSPIPIRSRARVASTHSPIISAFFIVATSSDDACASQSENATVIQVQLNRAQKRRGRYDDSKRAAVSVSTVRLQSSGGPIVTPRRRHVNRTLAVHVRHVLYEPRRQLAP